MGVGAVGAAFREAHRLGDKHAARALLVWMAYQVLDEPWHDQPAMRFYGGFQTAAIGLGYPVTEPDDPRTRAALTAVKRTLRVLEQAGLIEQTRRASFGRTAEWRLTLEPLQPVDNSEPRSRRGGSKTDRSTGRRPTEMGVEDRPVQGSIFDLDGGRTATPLSVGPDRPGRADSDLFARERARARG